MQLLQKHTLPAAVIILTLATAAPVRGDVNVIEAYTVTSSGGLTRDSLSEANLTPTNAPRATTKTVVRHRRGRIDPKDFVASRSHHRHHDEVRQTRSQAMANHLPKRRGPVVGFVYWWNGWVIRTFHTKFGTVLLGTIGAKS